MNTPSNAMKQKLSNSLKYVALLVVCLSFFICGCGGDQAKEKVEPKAAYEVTDSRGKVLTFDEKPQRIVINYVYGEEILMDLVDHKRIVATSKWVHDPDLSLGYERAADVKNIVENNVESYISYKPDLVLMGSSFKPELIQNLEEVGLKVYVYKMASRMDEIPKMVLDIGKAVGEENKAQQLVKNMKERMEMVKAKVDKLKPEEHKAALLFLRLGPVGGAGSIYDDYLNAAGIENCHFRARPKDKSEDSWMNSVLTKEEVVRANPPNIIIGSWSQGGRYLTSDRQVEEMYNDPAYADVEAIKNKRIIVIPQSCVNCLSHNAATGVERLYEAVYEK